MKWQTVETLPLEEVRVLVIEDGFIEIAEFYNKQWIDDWGGKITPSHWMPLPNPLSYK